MGLIEIMSVDVNQTASLWIIISGVSSTGIFLIKRVIQFGKDQKDLKSTVTELKYEVAEHRLYLDKLIKEVTPNGGNTAANGDITLRTERKVNDILQLLKERN